jgi:FAD/FMN-containing dehydrogenase
MRTLAIRLPAAYTHVKNATPPDRKSPNADEAAWEPLSRWIRAFWTQPRLTRQVDGVEDSRYAHPTTERALIALVQRARQEGQRLRVRGLEHSVYSAIHVDGAPPANSANLNVMLDRYTRILHWNEAKKQVTVQAGCYLGIDPNDPLSKRENSLLYQLKQRGWALPALGGTTPYELADSIACIRMIDGTGKLLKLRPSPDDPHDTETNPVYAAGVSMGLLGVISTVTFQCEQRHDPISQQLTRVTPLRRVRQEAVQREAVLKKTA